MTIIKSGIFIIISVLMFYLFQSNKTMHPVWLVPYLSGAKNYSYDGPWLYSKKELNDIKENGSYEYFLNYQFKKYNKDDLVLNQYNKKNFLYVVIAISKMFWWMPMLKAVKLFQFLMHLLLSCLLLSNLSRHKRYMFLLAYVWNPFIIYLATFPFYYFYQFIPSVIALIILKQNITKPWFLYLMMVVLGFLINVRTTIIFLVFAIIFYFYRKFTAKELLIGVIILVITLFSASSSESAKSPWHTMYIGIGAYPNNHLSELSDFTGMRLYKDVTGKNVNFNDKEDYKDYSNIMKIHYLEILKKDPVLLMRNAVFNFLQAFAFGHFANKGLMINVASILCGLFVLIYMILKKKYNYIILISAAGIGHCLYYPPIQQYMFGSFVIIIFGIIDSINPLVSLQTLKNLRLNKLKFSLQKD